MNTPEGKPKRLRPWLEGLLDRGDIPGLRWLDDQRTMFRISWKHHGKQGWSPEQHGRVFMEWAKQTGRYREGVDNEDYPTWKTRLRCALNKVPDVEEVREMRSTDSADPHRVYRFRDLVPTPSVHHDVSSQPRVIPTVVAAAAAAATLCQDGDDYQSLETTDAHINVNEFELPGANVFYIQQTVDVAAGDEVDVKRMKLDLDTVTTDVTDVSDAACYSALLNPADECYLQGAAKQETHFDTFAVQTQDDSDAGELELVVSVRYCGQEVLNRRLNGRTGCRLCYDQPRTSELVSNIFPDELGQLLLGSRQAEEIALPPCEQFMSVEVQRNVATEMLSQWLQRGLVICCRDNNVFMYRLCQCAVFYYKQSAAYEAGQPAIKLRRTEASPDDMTCLFDYGHYVAALKDYLDGRGPKPDPHSVLVFGQERPFCPNDPTVLVSVTVTTSKALEDLSKAEAAMALRTPTVHVSASNEFDDLTRFVNHMELDRQSMTTFVPEVKYSPDYEQCDADDFAEQLKPNNDLL